MSSRVQRHGVGRAGELSLELGVAVLVEIETSLRGECRASAAPASSRPFAARAHRSRPRASSPDRLAPRRPTVAAASERSSSPSARRRRRRVGEAGTAPDRDRACRSLMRQSARQALDTASKRVASRRACVRRSGVGGLRHLQRAGGKHDLHRQGRRRRRRESAGDSSRSTTRPSLRSSVGYDPIAATI